MPLGEKGMAAMGWHADSGMHLCSMSATMTAVPSMRPRMRMRQSQALVYWCSSTVQRAQHRAGATAQDMRVDLCGAQVLVSEQLLHGADVLPRFEEMRGE